MATLGLNPSRLEFLDRKGRLLTGQGSRLASLASLGIARLNVATTTHHKRILDSCICYFQKKPYWRWFGKFEPILSQLGASYVAGTACHLDLVQTATDPVWRGLSPMEKASYLQHEAWFLAEQLKQHSVRKLLLNGRGVVDAFVNHFNVGLSSAKHKGPKDQSFEFFRGTISLAGRTIDVRGWNINIQSSQIPGGAPVAAIGALCT